MQTRSKLPDTDDTRRLGLGVRQPELWPVPELQGMHLVSTNSQGAGKCIGAISL